jgi:hypothetical protein
MIRFIAWIMLMVPLVGGCEQTRPADQWAIVVATTPDCPACEREKPSVAALRKAMPKLLVQELCPCDPDDRLVLEAAGIRSYPTYLLLRSDNGYGYDEVLRTHAIADVIKRINQ